jgi:hypothetical protein
MTWRATSVSRWFGGAGLLAPTRLALSWRLIGWLPPSGKS